MSSSHFSFSSSSSATFVSTSSSNGQAPQACAYKREAYSTNGGSGVRTTRQVLGQAPVTKVMMYDAQGRPLLVDSLGNGNGSGSLHQSDAIGGPNRRIISIKDVTEEEDKKARDAGRQ